MRLKRFFAVLLTALIIMQVLCVTASARTESGFVTDIETEDVSNGTLVTVTVTGMNGEDEDDFSELVYELEPYIYVSRGDQEYGRYYLEPDGDSAVFSKVFETPGEYEICLVDRDGDLGCYLGEDGSYYLDFRSFTVSGSASRVKESLLSRYRSAGFAFTADLNETDTGISVHLGSVDDISSGELSALVRARRPYVRCTLVDGDGNSTENTIAFRAVSSGAADVNVSFGDAKAVYVEVLENSADYYAVMYVEGPGGDVYCGSAFFRYGDAEVSDMSFSDVPSGMWYSDYVADAVRMGLVNGMGDGKYAPDSNLTYAQAITLAARIRAFYRGQDKNAVFTQTTPWYETYVSYAKANKIPCDFPDYNAPITRRDFVHIFRAAMPDSEYAFINEIADGAIPDVSAGARYASDIYLFYRAGILTGSDAKHNFYPDNTIKRSEVAAIVCRMLNIDRKSFEM